MLLADAILTIQRFVTAVVSVYTLCILVHILLSWFQLPYNPWLARVRDFFHDVSEPYLRLFRRLLPSVRLGGMGLDLSPIVAIIVLYAVRELAVRLLGLAR